MSDCPAIECPEWCEHGYLTDSDGCPSCDCKSSPECPEMMCAMFCEHGFEKDSNGCDVC